MRTSNSAYAKFCTCYAINDNKSFAENAQLKTKQIEHIHHKTCMVGQSDIKICYWSAESSSVTKHQ